MHFVLAILTLALTLTNFGSTQQQSEPAKGQGQTGTSFTYVPLENRKEDLAILRSYWPMKEDAFIADLYSLDALRWAIVVCEAKSDSETGVKTGGGNSSRAIEGGTGILDNDEALDEIETLRQFIEEKHTIKVRNDDIRYINVCLSYQSPVTNRTVCRFPEGSLAQVLRFSVRQPLWKSFQNPTLYPLYGDKGAPLGLKMITGPILGGVEADKATGELRSVKSIAMRYFFQTQAPPDDIDRISSQWRVALREYILNKYMSTVIDVRYVDDDMMKLRLDEKSSGQNLVSRLLDPTPTSTSSGFWPDGLTAQLIFNAVPDLSREAEVKRILKTLAAFENTAYTFGDEGTVCWLRAFLSWRKWLVSHLYGGPVENADANAENNNNQEETTLVSTATPFGSFREDLRIFLQNRNFPVYSQHVFLADPVGNGDGQSDVKAFRCLITLKNLTDQNQRVQAVQSLRDIASRWPQYNITVIAVDFFPPVPLSAPAKSPLNVFVPSVFGIVAIFVNRFIFH